MCFEFRISASQNILWLHAKWLKQQTATTGAGLINGLAAFSAQPVSVSIKLFFQTAQRLYVHRLRLYVLHDNNMSMNGTVRLLVAAQGCCEPEAPPPGANSRVGVATGIGLPFKKAAQSSERCIESKICRCSGVCSFLGAFRHLPFSAMFGYCLCQGLPAGVTIYFLQYFLQDVIETGPDGYDLSLLGLRYDHTKSAESATALVNIATSWSQLLTSLVKTHTLCRVPAMLTE